jgi:hypothetical protein
MPNVTVGKLLKQFSMDTGISQKDVAEKIALFAAKSK